MNKLEFSIIYPTLAGALSGEFQYPDGRPDEELARTLRGDLGVKQRRQLLQRLLIDCRELMPNISGQWQVLSDTANRSLDTPDQARDWLALVMGAWKAELSRLEGNGSNH